MLKFDHTSIRNVKKMMEAGATTSDTFKRHNNRHLSHWVYYSYIGVNVSMYALGIYIIIKLLA